MANKALCLVLCVLQVVSPILSALTSCQTVGGDLYCNGEYDHVGSLNGDIVKPSDFTLNGEEYSPVSPIEFQVTKGKAEYGNVYCNTRYPQAIPYFACANEDYAASAFYYGTGTAAGWYFTINWSAVGIDPMEYSPVPLGTTLTSGNTTIATHQSATQCLFPSLPLDVTAIERCVGGIRPGKVGKLCSLDHAQMKQYVSVKATVDGVTTLVNYDALSKPVGMDDYVSISSLTAAATYPFLWRSDTGEYFVPNANYTNEPVSNNTLFRDWTDWAFGNGIYGAFSTGIVQSGVNSALLSRREYYCNEWDAPLGKNNTKGFLTINKLSTLPAELAVATVDGVSKLYSLAPTIENKITVKYGAKFTKNGPKVSLKQIEDVACGSSSYVKVLYNNTGNAGAGVLVGYYEDGSTVEAPYQFISGEKLIRFQYAGVNKICSGDDCVHIVCSEPLPLEKTVSKWFNFKHDLGMAMFQLFGVMTMGIIFIIFMFYSIKLVRHRGWRIWRAPRYNAIPMGKRA